MKLLREYIRALLTEAAKGPADLPDNVFVAVQDKGDRIRIFYAVEDPGTGKYVRADRASAGINGIIMVGPAYTKGSSKAGPCGGAWEVYSSNAKQGWGPMLYDTAMELATQRGGGLISDRAQVSRDAERVWVYYLSKRGDVQAHQLDSLEDELTPGVEEDNCYQGLARDHSYRTGPNMLKNWSESQFSKRYTKAPTTMNALEVAGKLVML